MMKHKIIKWIINWLQDPFLLKKWESLSPYRLNRRHSDQLSADVRVWGGTPYPYHSDSGMFVDDLYTGIMPFMIYAGADEKYPVVTEPEIGFELKRIIASGISSRDSSFRLESALCEFVRDTTQRLLINGIVFYEINQIRNEDGEIESFEFEPIHSRYLYKFGSVYYQIIPWHIARANETKVQIIKIPAEKILAVKMPVGFPDKKKLRHILKRLYYMGKVIIPEFQTKAMEKNQNFGFDWKEYPKNKYLMKAILTKSFGWDQRHLMRKTNYLTEYYSIVRMLRKRRFEARIRRNIIDALNHALNGEVLNLSLNIEMQNLPTEENVDEQEVLLKKGGVKFVEIFHALNIK